MLHHHSGRAAARSPARDLNFVPLSAMSFRIFSALAATAVITLSSCTVVPDPPANNAQKKPDATLSDEEQQKIAEQREKKKKEAEEAIKQKPADPGDIANNPDANRPKPTPPRTDIPTAQPVPGKEGYVFSPYNQKIVDVREIPSGTRVADPTYPPSEKKHFRVP